MSNLLTAIRLLLPAIVSQSTWDQAADNDRFEGYLFALVLLAATKEGATVRLENVNGAFNGVASFRTSPGHIWSDIRPFTHAVLEFSNKPSLEAHVGVYISGRSKLFHEADVAVLGRAVAATCRANQVDPPSSDAALLIECKHHVADPGVRFGREFLGFSSECGLDKCVFATNQEIARLQKLFRSHDREWGHSILPGQTSDVERLLGFAQRAFTRYKAAR